VAIPLSFQIGKGAISTAFMWSGLRTPAPVPRLHSTNAKKVLMGNRQLVRVNHRDEAVMRGDMMPT
jgi:hypothetical protein